MKVLVTGSRGFIGQNLVKLLLKRTDIEQLVGCCRSNPSKPTITKINGVDYREVHCNIGGDGQACAYMLATYKPDVIFHLAGNPLTKLSEKDPYGFGIWDTNVTGTHNLLAYAPAGCRFVYASSAAVYGDAGMTHRCHEEQGAEPTAVYGASKLAGEGLVQAFTSLGKVRGVILRYVANVGPGSTHGALHDFIRKLRSPAEFLELIGDAPGSSKPYCHVTDTARATILVGFSGRDGIWNVSSNNSLTIEEVAKDAMQAIGITKELKWLGAKANWPGDNRVVRVSNCKLKSLGWQPLYPWSGEAIRQASKEIGAA